MSRLNELVKELCPNGVEYVPLWQLTAWDKKFNAVEDSKQKYVIKYNYLLAKDLRLLRVDGGDIKLLSTGDDDYGYTTDELGGDIASEGEIVAIPWGGNANIQYYKGRFITSDNRIATSLDKNRLDNKYLYYCMLSRKREIASFYRGSGIKHPSMRKVLDLKIPLPPLKIQQEIVKILDKFTQLQAELQAELDLRLKQYEHYRDELLSFDKLSDLAGGVVRRVRLGELCDIKNGYTPSKNVYEYWNGDTVVPWFRMDDIRQNGHILNDSIQHVTREAVKNGKLFPKNSIILATTATIGEHALITADSLANQQFTYLIIREPLRQFMDVKFFYYYMYVIDEWCKKNVNVSGFASVNMQGLKQQEVPVPPIRMQQEIAKILDKFSSMATSLTSGLPAEIKLRQQQYEYYRDKLLSFNPL